MSDVFEHSAEKMKAHGMSDTAVAQFKRLYDVWRTEEASSWIREDDVEPLTGVPSFHDVYKTIDHDKAVDAFAKTAFLKLNGGLGTSMGLECAKSLLPVRRHKAKQMRFIDIIIGQVVTARTRLNVRLPLTLMNSFRTSEDTMKVLKANRHFTQDDVPMEIIQHVEPKIVAETGEPVEFPENPDLEWCPPGHGDLYSTIWESGLLDILEEQGFKYLFISNSDNLGARPSRTLAQHFENTGAPFMVEVATRTYADRKGGHIVRDKATGRLLLREMSQVHDADKAAAQDIAKHPYFNTNSIWVRIDALKAKLAEYDGVLPLPVIRNFKTVDPTDRDGRGHQPVRRRHLRAGGPHAVPAGQDHERPVHHAVGPVPPDRLLRDGGRQLHLPERGPRPALLQEHQRFQRTVPVFGAVAGRREFGDGAGRLDVRAERHHVRRRHAGGPGTPQLRAERRVCGTAGHRAR